MKASELMIGDWVQIRLGRKLKLELDQFYAQGCHEFREHPIDYFSTFDPIPLTKEILMANGFRCVNENSAYTLMVMNDEGYTIEVYICIANCVFNVEHNYTLNKERVKDRTHKCGYYVHELQHVLRLCGLNGLADNFKVTADGVSTPPSAPNK